MFEEINLKTRGYNTHILSNIEIEESVQVLNDIQLINFVESISQMVLILNRRQQIVYANKSFNDFFDSKSIKHILGKRPGDKFKCRNAVQSKYGCGTSKSCKSCGAANAIIEAVKGNSSTRECKILTAKNDAIDLRVTASPLKLNDTDFTIFSIIDISHEKRRRSLERIFIHDILNIAGGINGLSAILKEINDPEEIRQIAKTIENASNNLIEEIQIQSELSLAERGDLTLHYTELQSQKILTELKMLYSNHEANYNKPISILTPEDFSFVTDKVLLKRILGNMIKNAVEAPVQDDHIVLSCKSIENRVRFEVHNNSVISNEVQRELFKRFYSTKQIGRGIGTYSMKLFGEKYLKGKVWFTSSVQDGTSFFFELSV